MFADFNVPSEDVGSIELTLSVPYGKHVTLGWSMMGTIIIPVESHDKPFTVRVLTDGLADWTGPRQMLALTTDGIQPGLIVVHSISFLPRISSFPKQTDLQRVKLGHDLKSAIYMHCPTDITYDNLTLPPNAVLTAGLGRIPAALTDSTPGKTHFKIILTHDGVEHTVFDREVDISDQWHEINLSLNSWSAKTVTLTLITDSTNSGSVALWANPRIYQPLENPPLMVLYLIDTVAAEHVGFQGYERPTMPRLAEMVEQGVWFARMFSNSSRTIESIPDLMLSMETERHGVHHFSTPAPPALVTMADALRAAGFSTISFCTNVNAGPRQGMDQGFETFVDKISAHDDTADRTIPLDEVMAWLALHRDRPAFLYIHTAEPHSPYTPPPGFRGRFDPDYTGRFDGKDFYKARQPRDIAHIRALYDEEILYADQRLGLFLDALRRDNLLDRTDFLVTSDHGEEFLQHNDWEHGRNLHNEETRIPLVAFGPSFSQRGRVDTPAQLLDLLPTVLEMYDLPWPYRLDGRSLLPILRAAPGAEDALARREIIASNHNYRIEYQLFEYSIIENGCWKLVLRAAGAPMYKDGPISRFMLYDLRTDPRERKNQMFTQKEITRRLAEKLVAWRLQQHVYRSDDTSSTIIDSDQMKQLEALGYVGDRTAPVNLED